MSQLQEATENEKEEEAKRLKEILQDEAQEKAWASVHRQLKQTRDPSPMEVKPPWMIAQQDSVLQKSRLKKE